MNEIRLFFDTSLFTLIWLVQLIIYPSFLYYLKDEFLIWHKKYTTRLTFIVAPLLAGQGLSVAYQFFTDMSWYSFISSVLITSVIGYTFVYFIPLHTSLEKNYSLSTIRKLIKNNWYRTVLWTLVVVIDLIHLYSIK